MKKIKVFAAALVMVLAANVGAMAQESSQNVVDCYLSVTADDGTIIEVIDPGCKRTKEIIDIIMTLFP